MSSTLPPPIEGAIFPDYWLQSPVSRALPTSAGTNRVNWDLHYDDPPSISHDLEDEMNMVEGMTSPGPHGPQAPPGTYTLKLTVAGTVLTQTVVVHNDPRVGESAATLSALKSQHALTMLAYQGMKDSQSGNEEIAAARAQVAPLLQGQSGDVAAKAKEFDTKLATFGGAVDGRGGRGGFGGRGSAAPGGMQSFIALNGSFNTMISMMQVGLDMPPTAAQIATWETDCRNYNATVAAWQKAQSDDFAAFNTVLTQNSLKPLTVSQTRLPTESCTFAGQTAAARR
jgi:hypothetical protein